MPWIAALLQPSDRTQGGRPLTRLMSSGVLTVSSIFDEKRDAEPEQGTHDDGQQDIGAGAGPDRAAPGPRRFGDDDVVGGLRLGQFDLLVAGDQGGVGVAILSQAGLKTRALGVVGDGVQLLLRISQILLGSGYLLFQLDLDSVTRPNRISALRSIKTAGKVLAIWAARLRDDAFNLDLQQLRVRTGVTVMAPASILGVTPRR